MAFHLHLIELLWDLIHPATAQRGRNSASATSAQLGLSLQWYLGDGGRLHSRWTPARD